MTYQERRKTLWLFGLAVLAATMGATGARADQDRTPGNRSDRFGNPSLVNSKPNPELGDEDEDEDARGDEDDEDDEDEDSDEDDEDEDVAAADDEDEDVAAADDEDEDEDEDEAGSGSTTSGKGRAKYGNPTWVSSSEPPRD